MRDLKTGQWYSGETRRCTNCGSDSDSGMMTESGVECIDCVELLNGRWKTLAQWILWYNARDKRIRFIHPEAKTVKLEGTSLEFRLMYQRDGRRWYCQSAK
jgi:hypothetical protein